MNGFAWAKDNPIFKDAVNEYVHKRMMRVADGGHGMKLDEIEPGFCDAHSKFEIYIEWDGCYTQQDRDEVRTHCVELARISEYEQMKLKYFEDQLKEEMESQIRMLAEEMAL